MTYNVSSGTLSLYTTFLVFAQIRLTNHSTLKTFRVHSSAFLSISFTNIDFSSHSHYSSGLSLVLARTVIFRADVKFTVASS